MFRLSILLTALIFTACKRDNEPVESTTSEALANKKAFYCAEGKRVLSERGFMDDKCDSLLFTSLWAVACEPSFSVQEWEDQEFPGKWHRNPQRDCYLNGAPNGAASSISRDMMLGLWHLLWTKKDGENVRNLVNYGEKNNWVMGEAKDTETLISRATLSPQLVVLLKKMDEKLGGSSASTMNLTAADDSADAIGVNTGFRAHLDILRILLQGRVNGAITDSEKALLKAQAERQPNNALFVAAYEKYNGGTKAHSLLLEEKHFPSDRLPTNHEHHCINYLYSRDEGSEDWIPCTDKPFREHDGSDFVFAAWVALNL